MASSNGTNTAAAAAGGAKQTTLKIKRAKRSEGTKLIPWNNQTTGPPLVECLMKLVRTQQMFIKPKGETRTADQRWQAFVDDILWKQPAFQPYAGFVSGRQVREKYNELFAASCKQMGWMDENGGFRGNISGHKGDLTPAYVAIKVLRRHSRIV